MTAYAELHALSNFSFLRGASHPAELIAQAHALGYRALALTDECSLAGVVRAHEACGCAAAASLRPSSSSSAPSFARVCGLKLVLLAPSQRAYGQICQLITLGRRRSKKGEYRLTRADFESGLDDCLALWIAARGAEPPCAAGARGCAIFSRDAAGWRVELHRGADDAARLRRRAGAGRAQRPAGGRRRRCAHACALAPRAAGCAHGDPSRLHRSMRPAGGCIRMPSGICARWRELRALYPPALLDESVAIAERCSFSLVAAAL